MPKPLNEATAAGPMGVREPRLSQRTARWASARRALRGPLGLGVLACGLVLACGRDEPISNRTGAGGAGLAGGTSGTGNSSTGATGTGGAGTGGAGAAGPPLRCRDVAELGAGGGGISFPAQETASGPPAPARTSVTCMDPLAAPLSLSLPSLTRGSQAHFVEVWGGYDSSLPIVVAAVNGQSTLVSSPPLGYPRILLPAADLAQAGPLRIDLLQSDGCHRGIVTVFDDNAANPVVPAVKLSQVSFDLNASSACVVAQGGPFVVDPYLPTRFYLWRAIDDVSLVQAEVDAGTGASFLTLSAKDLSVPGDAWLYAVNSTGQKNPNTSTAGRWVKVHTNGQNEVPDLVDANPPTLPLGDIDFERTLTLTSRGHFGAGTTVRARRSDGMTFVLGTCPTFGRTCAVPISSDVTAVAGPLELVATSPGAGDGAPFTVQVENPTPRLTENGLAQVLTVSATEDQEITFTGSGFVAAGPKAQWSRGEETATGMRLEVLVGSGQIGTMKVPPSLVTKVGTLFVRVINPGANGAGPALISNALPVTVRVAPWLSGLSPSHVSAATSVRITLTGTNLEASGPKPPLVNLNGDAIPFVNAPAPFAPLTHGATSWTFDFPGGVFAPGQAAVSVYLPDGSPSNNLLFNLE